MDLSRIGSGVYRLKIEGEEDQLVSGKLYHVMQLASEVGSNKVEYLTTIDGKLTWNEVNVDKHLHYHGEQTKLLCHWFYVLGCGLSKFGFRRFEQITGVSAGRIQDAMRRADTISHKPLSSQALLFIDYKVKEYLEANQKEPQQA